MSETEPQPRRSGVARLYLGPEPTGPEPHPGYRGPMEVDALGVHLTEECDYLPVGSEQGDPWEPVDQYWDGGILIPWHRVDQIEWHGAGWEAERDAA